MNNYLQTHKIKKKKTKKKNKKNKKKKKQNNTNEVQFISFESFIARSVAKTINERFVFIPLDKHLGEKIKAKVVLIFLGEWTTSLWITPLSILNHRKGVCQLSFTRKSVP